MDNPSCFGALLPIGIHMAHNVMPYQLFPFLRHLIIDILGMAFQLVYLLLRNDWLPVFAQPQFHFCFCKGNPQFPPGTEFHIRGKNILHFLACIPL